MSTIKILNTLLASLPRNDYYVDRDEYEDTYVSFYTDATGPWVRFDDIETIINKMKADILSRGVNEHTSS